MENYKFRNCLYVVGDLFKFASHEAGQNVLEEGPWFVHGHPLILKQWFEDISMYRHNLERIPIWVWFPNLNFFV